MQEGNHKKEENERLEKTQKQNIQVDNEYLKCDSLSK